MKTLRKIKLFKLDSMNPKDVQGCIVQFNSANQHDVPLIHKTLLIVGILCQLKCQALNGQADFDNCREWSQLALSICENLQEGITWGPTKGVDTFLGQFVHAIITLSACDYSKRRSNYDRLMCHLFSNPRYLVLLMILAFNFRGL